MLIKRFFLKNLLYIFDYIKSYHSNMYEVLIISLSLTYLKIKEEKNIAKYIEDIEYKDYLKEKLKQILKDLYLGYKEVSLNEEINFNKLIKLIANSEINIENIENFLHTVTIKKTVNKLYEYATPIELNKLIIALCEVKENESIYNPCYGMGNFFLSIKKNLSKFNLYGEELDENAFYIAKLICKIVDIDDSNIFINDILKSPKFKDMKAYKKFDKIICNPPFFTHLNTKSLEKRYPLYGLASKNSPESAFLIHSLMHMKKKAIILIRSSYLNKSLLEAKIREKLFEEKKIEAIIELPKNLFPHRQEETSILILSNNNEKILHIKADSFFKKNGKYNSLIKIDEILDLYKNKKIGKYSSLTKLKDINIDNLRANNYVNLNKEDILGVKLESVLKDLFRGRRVYGNSKDEDIEYFDLGINDFKAYGFTTKINIKRTKGNIKKIKESLLKTYDILLPLRGNTAKVSILGEIKTKKIVANVGIIILRLKNKETAIKLYMYLISKIGKEKIQNLYKNSSLNTINLEELKNLQIPANFNKKSLDNFQKINELAVKIENLEDKIKKIKDEF